MTFHVGQKVVCVDNSDWETRLVSGGVYTVTAIAPAHGEIFVGLAETPSKAGLQWRACRFRPLVTRSTDTGFAILEDIRKRESVPADEKVRAQHAASQSDGDAA